MPSFATLLYRWDINEVVICSGKWHIGVVFSVEMLVGWNDWRCWGEVVSTQHRSVIPCIENSLGGIPPSIALWGGEELLVSALRVSMRLCWADHQQIQCTLWSFIEQKTSFIKAVRFHCTLSTSSLIAHQLWNGAQFLQQKWLKICRRYFQYEISCTKILKRKFWTHIFVKSRASKSSWLRLLEPISLTDKKMNQYQGLFD